MKRALKQARERFNSQGQPIAVIKWHRIKGIKRRFRYEATDYQSAELMARMGAAKIVELVC